MSIWNPQLLQLGSVGLLTPPFNEDSCATNIGCNIQSNGSRWSYTDSHPRHTYCFDTVINSKLLNCLHHSFGIGRNSLLWISLYLNKWSQTVWKCWLNHPVCFIIQLHLWKASTISSWAASFQCEHISNEECLWRTPCQSTAAYWWHETYHVNVKLPSWLLRHRCTTQKPASLTSKNGLLRTS